MLPAFPFFKSTAQKLVLNQLLFDVLVGLHRGFLPPQKRASPDKFLIVKILNSTKLEVLLNRTAFQITHLNVTLSRLIIVENVFHRFRLKNFPGLNRSHVGKLFYIKGFVLRKFNNPVYNLRIEDFRNYCFFCHNMQY